MALDGKSAIGCCVCSVVTLISVILFALSFDVLEPLQMGLMFDNNIQQLEFDRTYFSGRYFTGLGRSFVAFPSNYTYETLRFGSTFENADGGDVTVRTREGLEMKIEFSFQYRLDPAPKSLARLHLDYGGEHAKLYSQLSLQIARDKAAQYQARDFFTKRDIIARDMREALEERLSLIGAHVPTLELVNMEIDGSFAKAIEVTQVMRQEVLQAGFEQEVARVDAEKARDVEIALAKVKVEAAGFQAQKVLAMAQAQADALRFRIKTQVEGFQELRTRLALNSSDELLRYTFVDSIQNSKVKDLILAGDFPKAFAF